MSRHARRSFRPTAPRRQLPEGYRRQGTFSLSLARPHMLIGLNALGVAVFLAAGWGLLDTALRWRPELGDEIVRQASGSNLLFIFGNVIGLVAAVVLHELVHGLGFWWLTGSRPTFGFRFAYAYAAAPEWYLPRGAYLWVGLAPLLALSALGLLGLGLAPVAMLPALLFGIASNIAGSVGDVAVTIWLLRQPSRLLAQDLGDAIHVYW